MKIRSVIFILCFSKLAFSQTPSIQWQKCLGGSQIDAFGTLKDGFDIMSDRGAIIASRTNSNNGDVNGNH